MTFTSNLKMMLAAVIQKKPDASDDAFDYPLACMLLRYQKLLEPSIDETISGHIRSIVNRQQAIRARDAYTKLYLDNLDLPYEGIQALCQNLILVFKRHNVKPTDTQIRYADGKFDWVRDYMDYQN